MFDRFLDAVLLAATSEDLRGASVPSMGGGQGGFRLGMKYSVLLFLSSLAAC